VSLKVALSEAGILRFGLDAHAVKLPEGSREEGSHKKAKKKREETARSKRKRTVKAGH